MQWYNTIFVLRLTFASVQVLLYLGSVVVNTPEVGPCIVLVKSTFFREEEREGEEGREDREEGREVGSREEVRYLVTLV
jgi:hypothetical protein